MPPQHVLSFRLSHHTVWTAAMQLGSRQCRKFTDIKGFGLSRQLTPNDFVPFAHYPLGGKKKLISSSPVSREASHQIPLLLNKESCKLRVPRRGDAGPPGSLLTSQSCNLENSRLRRLACSPGGTGGATGRSHLHPVPGLADTFLSPTSLFCPSDFSLLSTQALP